VLRTNRVSGAITEAALLRVSPVKSVGCETPMEIVVMFVCAPEGQRCKERTVFDCSVSTRDRETL